MHTTIRHCQYTGNLFLQSSPSQFLRPPRDQLYSRVTNFTVILLNRHIFGESQFGTYSTMDVDPRQYDNVAINEKDVSNIVLSYLIHNCYEESAESFIASTGMKRPTDYLDNMEKRKKIFHYALEGNALKAIELTEQLSPEILEKNTDLLFDLLSLHFVELVRSRKCTEALEFAQTKLSPFGKEGKYMEKLEDFMALLAYKEPEDAPMFHLLSFEYRQQFADSLNRTILAYFNLPNYTAMERLVQQATTVRQCLNEEAGKDAPRLFSLKEFLNM